ncbi:MAG: DNA starvation/stationary phase protection protein [Gammaproteobacteria bacterium]|nr:MAG: DNA starvation/stationary phase protection protein [Gammaproteobacteria bacterium]
MNNNSPKINIGISEENRIATAEALKKLLSDSYTLYLQTHNFHWNVTGVRFRDLHMMFEEQYTELATAIDEIAERIRSLGVFAPGTYQTFLQLAAIKPVEHIPNAEEMVTILTENHEQVVQTCRQALKIAQDADDESSISLISDRMVIHEKTAWMLRAMSQ